MTDFVVIYEQAGDKTWHARAADVPVFSVGETREAAEREVRSAIAQHLEALRRRGESAPEISTEIGTVSV